MAERINIGKFINNLDTEDLSSEKLQGVVNNVYAKAIKDKRTRDKRVADVTKDQDAELIKFVKSNHDRLKAHGSKIEKDIDKDDAKVVEPKGEVNEPLTEDLNESSETQSFWDLIDDIYNKAYDTDEEEVQNWSLKSTTDMYNYYVKTGDYEGLVDELFGFAEAVGRPSMFDYEISKIYKISREDSANKRYESLSEAAVSPFPDRSIFNKVRGYEKQHLPSGFTFADVDTMRRVDRIGGKSPEDMCDIIKAEIYYGSEDGRELCTEKTYKVFDDGRVEEISQLADEGEPVEEAYIRKEIGSKELWGYINQVLKRSYRRLEDEDGIIDPYDIAQILENKYDISGYDNNVTHLVEDIVDALHWWGKDELSKYNLQLKQAPDNDYYLVPTGFEFEESLKEEKAKKASENTKRMWTSIAARRKGLPSFSKWVEEQGYDIDEVDDDKKLSDELRSKYREFVRSNKSLKENAKSNIRPWWVLFFDEAGHNRAGSEWSHAFNTPPIATERRILAPDYVKPKGAVGYMILSDSEFNALDYDEIDKNYKRWGKKLPTNESLELNEDSREERERWYRFRDQIESYLKAQGLIYHRSTYENPYWRFTRRGNTPILRWMFTRSGFDWMLARGTDYYDRYNSFARGEVDFEKSELFREDGPQKVFEKIKPELDRAIELGRRYLKDLRDGTVAFPYGTAAEVKDESLELKEESNKGSFSFIDTQSGQRFGPYDTIGIATNKANQYGGPGLVIIDNTNRKWYRLANGKALPMGTIPAGFDLGEEAGVTKKTKNNTICEEDDRFAELKAQWEDLSDRIKVIEFDNGDYYYIDVDWEKGTIFAGSATNTGVLREFEINLDPDLNIDENIAELYDYIVNQRPDLIGDQFEENLCETQATKEVDQARTSEKASPEYARGVRSLMKLADSWSSELYVEGKREFGSVPFKWEDVKSVRKTGVDDDYVITLNDGTVWNWGTSGRLGVTRINLRLAKKGDQFEEDLQEAQATGDKPQANPNFNKEKFGKYFDDKGQLKPELRDEYFKAVRVDKQNARRGKRGMPFNKIVR